MVGENGLLLGQFRLNDNTDNDSFTRGDQVFARGSAQIFDVEIGSSLKCSLNTFGSRCNKVFEAYSAWGERLWLDIVCHDDIAFLLVNSIGDKKEN